MRGIVDDEVDRLSAKLALGDHSNPSWVGLRDPVVGAYSLTHFMRTAEIVERPHRCADIDSDEFLEIEPRREQCCRTALENPELEYVGRFGIGQNGRILF